MNLAVKRGRVGGAASPEEDAGARHSAVECSTDELVTLYSGDDGGQWRRRRWCKPSGRKPPRRHPPTLPRNPRRTGHPGSRVATGCQRRNFCGSRSANQSRGKGKPCSAAASRRRRVARPPAASGPSRQGRGNVASNAATRARTGCVRAGVCRPHSRPRWRPPPAGRPAISHPGRLLSNVSRWKCAPARAEQRRRRGRSTCSACTRATQALWGGHGPRWRA
jgi:hypothetical protein